MSRIGKIPVKIPDKINVTIEGDQITVKGPKGQLSRAIPDNILVIKEGENIQVSPKTKSIKSQQIYGLYRRLVANMVQGVSEGFQKKLTLQGVGYRSQVQGKKLILSVGYSHQVEIPAPDGIIISVEANTNVLVSGIDKELVGQVAANIRSIRPPEPYKGKGIRYEGEYVRQKVGKAGKK
uniref:Large ribosomal subunit protein uL6c n=1 Tax=Chroomonas mesostigmatica CCMP1168 TaxID=1195612 RepID=A0A248SPP9_9CRYP|nr:ribosomal protein L6 [Chroomonas mesostigmatica CCMP1168]